MKCFKNKQTNKQTKINLHKQFTLPASKKEFVELRF